MLFNHLNLYGSLHSDNVFRSNIVVSSVCSVAPLRDRRLVHNCTRMRFLVVPTPSHLPHEDWRFVIQISPRASKKRRSVCETRCFKKGRLHTTQFEKYNN
jgi:hypothetical protein